MNDVKHSVVGLLASLSILCNAAFLVGCEGAPRTSKAKGGQLKLSPEGENANHYKDDVVTIYYVHDPATNLCFAYMRETFDGGPALTHVPCSALRKNGMPLDTLPTLVSK